MSIKQRIRDYVMITVYFLGWLFVALLLILAVTFVVLKVDEHTDHLKLTSGQVTEKFAVHDHYWYSTWTFGDISVTKRNGGGKAYVVTVTNGDETDYWTLPEERWQSVNIGEYIGR